MSTKIFGVTYGFTELYNGKDGMEFKETKNVVANDAEQAIEAVKKINTKPHSFIDEETKKKVNVTRKGLTVLSVNLLAETD